MKSVLYFIAGMLVAVALGIVGFWAWDGLPDTVLLVPGTIAIMLGYAFLVYIIYLARRETRSSLVFWALFIFIPIVMLILGQLMIIVALGG